ncbi:MAG: ABC transporter ATP-binding protein [Acidobacteriota bacterium]
MESDAAVLLDGLSVRLGRRPVLDGVTARFGGRAIGLLGPNGAGKTTLINTLLGFVRPTSGSARVFGHDVRRRPSAVRALCGYMPETDAIVPGLTGVRFVCLMGELAGLPARDALVRAHDVLHFVGLGEARYRNVETYSTGMRQLVKLAQALVAGPRLLILDEPTAGLDPRHRAEFLRLVRELLEVDHVTVLISSHLLRDVEEVCDQVLILRDGRVAAFRDVAAERRAAAGSYDLELRGPEDEFVRRLAAAGVSLERAPRGRWRLEEGGPHTIPLLLETAVACGVQVRRLERRRDSLEEIFLQAMGEAP